MALLTKTRPAPHSRGARRVAIETHNIGERGGVRSGQELLNGGLLCAALAATVAFVALGAVLGLGLGDELRSKLGFGFAGVEQTPEQALGIALHNARFAAGILACALAAPHLPPQARHAVDLALAGLLAVNAGTVGVAVGAYGTRALLALAPHLPAEFAALSLAGGAYLSALGRTLRPSLLTRVALASTALLAAAALLETYVQLVTHT